ncbi:MAG TPA: regulatory protein RecX [Gemmatirosa sp.]
MAPAEPTVSAGAVTDLAPSSRRPGRWDVSVDGRVVGAVSLELVERVGLRVGRVLDDAAAALVADGIAEVSVYDRALAMLAARARSSRDLRQRLVRAGAAPAPVDAAVARLEASQLLDDAAYARQVARSRVATRGDSRRRVTQALAQAGVARDTADEAVADVFVDEAVDEVALVEQAARKRARTLGALAPEVRRRRLYGYLARRGHDASLIRAVVDRVLGGDSSEASVDGTEDDEA